MTWQNFRSRWGLEATKTILVLGDSHAHVFSDQSLRLRGYSFQVVAVDGATISGLKNPNSTTQAKAIFETAIEQSNAKICLTLLGEVDTGFVIWHQAQKYGKNVNELLHQTIENYQKFLQYLLEQRKIIVMGAPLPTIQDGQDWGEIANARKEIHASQRERTQLTLKLNQEIKQFTQQLGIPFMDLDELSLGPNGCVKRELRHRDPNDHHYDRKQYIKLLKPELLRCLDQANFSQKACL